MTRGTQADDGFGFGKVDDVLADPFAPGVVPASVRLPSVPKVRSADDDEAHHREYWRAHVWAALHRYRSAFEDPACPPSLRADHARVAEEAGRLVARATGTYPISPIDSVACHAALKDLVAGAASLEQTVAALRGAPGVPVADRPPAVSVPAGGGATTGQAGIGDATDDEAADGVQVGPGDSVQAPPGVHGQDFFAPTSTARGAETKPGSRPGRGLLHRRALTGGRPGD